MTNRFLFDQIVRELETHDQAIRIKKLLFCACHKRWENDLDILDSFLLDDLIEGIKEQNGSIEEVSSSLYRIVETLNRKDLYLVVANIIINKLGKLYRDSEDVTEIIMLKVPTNLDHNTDQLLQDISLGLEQHPEENRLKKLLFCVCYKRWENDSRLLDQTPLLSLLQDLYRSSLGREDIKNRLYQIVETLNRREKYYEIANIIIGELNRLYLGSLDTNVGDTDMRHTTMVKSIPTDNPITEATHKLTPPNITLTTTIRNDDFLERLAEMEDTPSITKKHYDPFIVRMELMKFANPLRTKILLFSLLHHPFDNSGRDWSILRTFDLDELLFTFYQSYSSLDQMQNRLYTMAKCLADSEEQTQTASAIIQTLKSFYS